MDMMDITNISPTPSHGDVATASSTGDKTSCSEPHATSAPLDFQVMAIEPSENVVAPRSPFRLYAIVTALFLSLFVSALDATIVSTAVPVISHDLNSATGYTWISAAYLLAGVPAGPIWGKLSDIWGRKLINLAALGLFFAASAICATAQNIRVLIAGRALQGTASGGLILLSHICISDLFSVRRRSLIMGLTEGIWAIAGGIGPVLGGIFASLVSWRWCFYINLPVSGLAFIMILFFLDVKHEQTSFREGLQAIDWFGMVAFLAFTLMLLLGLDFGGAIFPWSSAKVIALIVIGFLMLFVFLYAEARVAKYPLMPLDMFKNRSNVASTLVGFFHGTVFITAEYYMPLFLQSVLGVTPLVSGLLLLPLVVTTAIAGIVAGVFIHRTGRFRELIWIGSVFLCIGAGLLISLNAQTSFGRYIGYVLVYGTGSGLLFEAPLIAVQSQVKQHDVATATSTFNFMRNLALAVSVIVNGVVFQNSMDSQAGRLKAAGLSSQLLDQLSGANAGANVMLAESLSDHPVQQLAVKTAFAVSMRNVWILSTVFALCCLLVSFLVRSSHLAQEHTETVTGLPRDKPKVQDS